MGIIQCLAFTEWQIAPDLHLAARPSLMICTDGLARCINVRIMEVAHQTLRLLKVFIDQYWLGC